MKKADVVVVVVVHRCATGYVGNPLQPSGKCVPYSEGTAGCYFLRKNDRFTDPESLSLRALVYQTFHDQGCVLTLFQIIHDVTTKGRSVPAANHATAR